MLARSATVLLFTLLTQPSWSEDTRCITALTTALKGAFRSHVKEITYENFGDQPEKAPTIKVLRYGTTFLVGEFYKKTDGIIGNENSKCKCLKIGIKLLENEFLPKVRSITEGDDKISILTAEDIKRKFSTKSDIWICSNFKKGEDKVSFLRIVNLIESHPRHIPEYNPVNRVMYSSGVEVGLVNILKDDRSGIVERADARITEIKYLDENPPHERVKYFGEVELFY